MRSRRFMKLGALAAVTIALSVAAAPATAAQSVDSTGPVGSEATPTEITIDGRTFGPESGVNVVTEQFDTSTGERVGATYSGNGGGISPMATWGSSYAYSTEYMYVHYRGVGKAAANVFNGQRIVSVCFWWTRDGKSITGTTCSNARSNGSSWTAGAEASAIAWDSIVSDAPKTIFNIRTTRIAPGAL